MRVMLAAPLAGRHRWKCWAAARKSRSAVRRRPDARLPRQIDDRAMHREHEVLLDQVEQLRVAADELPALPAAERSLLQANAVAFLRGELMPHAREEERGLYPAVARRLGHPDATAPMILDHLAIGERTAQLAETDPEDVARLQELLYGLYALIRVHFWKEETLYAPLVESAAAHSI
jgi:iron-sulfur cluster repair protein YtfE (RIC family)